MTDFYFVLDDWVAALIGKKAHMDCDVRCQAFVLRGGFLLCVIGETGRVHMEFRYRLLEPDRRAKDRNDGKIEDRIER
ncbi:MAG: hypothetical protein LUI13_01200 [Lachnospiraceae bacterium]|nr:hypothetical protein [Lachnospiraceae bacterium]